MRGKISSVCYHLLSASLLGVIRWGTACYGRVYCRLHVRRPCVFVLLSPVRLGRHIAGKEIIVTPVRMLCAFFLVAICREEKEMCHVLHREEQDVK